MKIGVFDSGIGGMTIAKAIKDGLPNASIIFFADTLFFPYNNRKATEIEERVLRACSFLEQEGCSVVVFACNTASIIAWEVAKKEFSGRLCLFSILDFNIAAFLESAPPKKVIGIIGTTHTINSGYYEREIQRLNPGLVVKSMATPELAPFAEQYFLYRDRSELNLNILYDYLRSKELSDIDTLLLACTHYPILMDEIKKIYNDGIEVIDAIENTRIAISGLISSQNLPTMLDGTPSYSSYASSPTEIFAKASRYFLGQSVRISEARI